MSYKTTRIGIGDWADLIGKRISFEWSDGWDDYFQFNELLTGVQEQGGGDSRYRKYYLMLEHGGIAFPENAPVTVTVEENE